jgi:D-galactarolactone isomerase
MIEPLSKRVNAMGWPRRSAWCGESNWPHPNETQKPDYAALFDLTAKWAQDAATRNRIPVQNPMALYGLAKVA